MRAVAQIGTTIYVGGSFTSVGDGSGTIAWSHLVALDATTPPDPEALVDAEPAMESPVAG